MIMGRNWPAIVRRALAVLSLAISSPALAAMFVSVPGVPGNVPEASHRNWIQSESLSWGIRDSGTGPVVETVELVIESGLWATGLASLAARRQSVDPIVIDVADFFNGNLRVVTRMSLRNAIVRSIKLNQSAVAEVRSMLQISISFEQIEWAETAYDPSGRAIGNTLFKTSTTSTR